MFLSEKSLTITACCALFIVSFTCANAYSQHPKEKMTEGVDLVTQITVADRTFFDAFNQCDVKTMVDMFSKEVEFYHDVSGVAGYEKVVATTKANCEKPMGLTRRLLPETLKIYPLKDFGAIQKAEHRFCHLDNGKKDCGVFPFVHIWKLEEGRWRLFRIVSFDH